MSVWDISWAAAFLIGTIVIALGALHSIFTSDAALRGECIKMKELTPACELLLKARGGPSHG